MLYLKKGITEVRILPPHVDAKAWYMEIHEHGMHPEGKYLPITCPRSVPEDIGSEDCPICEKCQELWDLKTEEGLAEARGIKPRKNYFYNVMVYSCPDQIGLDAGTYVMKSPVTVWKGLLDLDQDKAGGYGDITNLQEGWDMRIKREGEGMLGTKYTVTARPKQTNILERVKNEGLELSTIKPYDLSGLPSVKTYEEIAVILKANQPPDRD